MRTTEPLSSESWWTELTFCSLSNGLNSDSQFMITHFSALVSYHETDWSTSTHAHKPANSLGVYGMQCTTEEVRRLFVCSLPFFSLFGSLFPLTVESVGAPLPSPMMGYKWSAKEGPNMRDTWPSIPCPFLTIRQRGIWHCCSRGHHKVISPSTRIHLQRPLIAADVVHKCLHSNQSRLEPTGVVEILISLLLGKYGSPSQLIAARVHVPFATHFWVGPGPHFHSFLGRSSAETTHCLDPRCNSFLGSSRSLSQPIVRAQVPVKAQYSSLVKCI